MTPEATTFAPFQKRIMPSSLSRIRDVFAKPRFDPPACIWVLIVSIGWKAKCSIMPAREPIIDKRHKLQSIKDVK